MNFMAKAALRNGKYVLDTRIGRGIFGITYRATHIESGQTVIIKTLSENLDQHSDAEQFNQQFLEVAKRLSRCQHPNLVQVLDYFEDAGRPFLVMEYIPGQTLANLIESAVLPEAQAIDYIHQIGAALSVLHKAGLLHRDIQPQNIILREDTGCVVLCEFGISCEFTPGVLQTHANLLSAGYAPLEQYTFEEQRTPATDIYALAATLYCLLLGRPPLPAPVRNSDALASLRASGLHSRGDRLFLPHLHKDRPKLDSAIKQVLWSGLELTAARRPQTLEAWLSMLPIRQPIAQPQSPLPQPTVATPNAQKRVPADLKPAPTQPQPSPQPPISQSELAEYFAAKLKTPDKTTVTVAAKHQVAKASSSSHPANANKAQKRFGRKSPLGALLMTGAIAASAGVGFGFALRINHPDEAGSTLLHTKQSFPPRSNWPVSEPRL